MEMEYPLNLEDNNLVGTHNLTISLSDCSENQLATVLQNIRCDAVLKGKLTT
jgi:hypothetical protein